MHIPDIKDDVGNNGDEDGVSSMALEVLKLHAHALCSTNQC